MAEDDDPHMKVDGSGGDETELSYGRGPRRAVDVREETKPTEDRRKSRDRTGLPVREGEIAFRKKKRPFAVRAGTARKRSEREKKPSPRSPFPKLRFLPSQISTKLRFVAKETRRKRRNGGKKQESETKLSYAKRKETTVRGCAFDENALS